VTERPGPRGAASPPEKSALQVLDRAFAVLALFTTDRSHWTVSQVAAELTLPVSTAHRILGVLLQHRFLARDDATKRFRLGPAALELGARGRTTIDARQVFLEALRALASATGETAMICTPNDTNDASLCVERIETSQPLRLSVEPGRTLPLHAGAMGKALLAFMPEERVARIAAGPLERLCAKTITSTSPLLAELAKIREQGYAVSFEETNTGLWGVAVPILDDRGDVYASVGTAGPIVRYVPEHFRRQLASCREAATKIAGALGLQVWTPAPPTNARRVPSRSRTGSKTASARSRPDRRANKSAVRQ
jgi:IclR family transcriptional regulator, acetate operon repressor